MSSTGEIFNQLDCAVLHILKWKGAEKNSKCYKEKTVRQKIKPHYFWSNQKLAFTNTIGFALLERVRKVQNEKIYLTVLLMVMDFKIVVMPIFQ